jgi:hypothetical protein
MANLFNTDIAGIMFQAMGNKLLPITLREPQLAARDPLNPSAGQPTTFVLHKSRGFEDTNTAKYFDKSLITTSDIVVAVLGKPLTTAPLPGWEAVSQGTAYSIVKVDVDPARALFLLLCRGQT